MKYLLITFFVLIAGQALADYKLLTTRPAVDGGLEVACSLTYDGKTKNIMCRFKDQADVDKNLATRMEKMITNAQAEDAEASVEKLAVVNEIEEFLKKNPTATKEDIAIKIGATISSEVPK